jgi:GMP synthase (glutamine-hydrolysing)
LLWHFRNADGSADEGGPHGEARQEWAAFAVLVQRVGAMEEERIYDVVCAGRTVIAIDGMTADVYRCDMSFLAALRRASMR